MESGHGLASTGSTAKDDAVCARKAGLSGDLQSFLEPDITIFKYCRPDICEQMVHARPSKKVFTRSSFAFLHAKSYFNVCV